MNQEKYIGSNTQHRPQGLLSVVTSAAFYVRKRLGNFSERFAGQLIIFLLILGSCPSSLSRNFFFGLRHLRAYTLLPPTESFQRRGWSEQLLTARRES
jgi:hypothetical protein